MPSAAPDASTNALLPVLTLRDRCLFPEASLEAPLGTVGAQRAVEMALRTGGRLLVIAQQEVTPGPQPRDLQAVGTVAELAGPPTGEGAQRVEVDGRRRARVVSLLGSETLVAEVRLLDEGDPGDDWGPAVEALARYLHAHPDLRAFIDSQRRSREPMAWVNLACQHLPITASARQKLLEASAAERCQKIARGLDALLRKEHGA